MIPDEIKAKIAIKFIGAIGSDARCKGIHSNLKFNIWPHSPNTGMGRCEDCGLTITHPLTDEPEAKSESAAHAEAIVASMASLKPSDADVAITEAHKPAKAKKKDVE